MKFQATLYTETTPFYGWSFQKHGPFEPTLTEEWSDTFSADSVEEAREKSLVDAPVNHVFYLDRYFTGSHGVHTIYSGVWHMRNGQPFKWKIILKELEG